MSTTSPKRDPDGFENQRPFTANCWRKANTPCVTIDIEVPGPNVSCVMMDDIKAFDELTQYLIDMGHRKIVVKYMAASWL